MRREVTPRAGSTFHRASRELLKTLVQDGRRGLVLCPRSLVLCPAGDDGDGQGVHSRIATVIGRARLRPSLFILPRLRLARTEPRPPGEKETALARGRGTSGAGGRDDVAPVEVGPEGDGADPAGVDQAVSGAPDAVPIPAVAGRTRTFPERTRGSEQTPIPNQYETITYVEARVSGIRDLAESARPGRTQARANGSERRRRRRDGPGTRIGPGGRPEGAVSPSAGGRTWCRSRPAGGRGPFYQTTPRKSPPNWSKFSMRPPLTSTGRLRLGTRKTREKR